MVLFHSVNTITYADRATSHTRINAYDILTQMPFDFKHSKRLTVTFGTFIQE
ncbi:Uncharacterised protein [Neisseria subflava]|uniref:Uncharacterized protein n=1 Tax=Neisseria subflava TaxID=28449 RepID=A0A9X9SN70_NEISU|nr:Uncharacterised protein [Neisseria subflava]